MSTDHQPLHSDFQIDHFIVARGNWTPYARYKQALREIDRRERAVEEMLCTIDELHLDIARLKRQWCFTSQSNARRKIELRRKRYALAQSQQALSETERELKRFCEIASDAKEVVGELTAAKRAELDAEMWESRIRAMVAIDLVTEGRIKAPTLELLVSIPDDMRQPILADMRKTIEANQRNEDGPMVQRLLSEIQKTA